MRSSFVQWCPQSRGEQQLGPGPQRRRGRTGTSRGARQACFQCSCSPSRLGWPWARQHFPPLRVHGFSWLAVGFTPLEGPGRKDALSDEQLPPARATEEGLWTREVQSVCFRQKSSPQTWLPSVAELIWVSGYEPHAERYYREREKHTCTYTCSRNMSESGLLRNSGPSMTYFKAVKICRGMPSGLDQRDPISLCSGLEEAATELLISPFCTCSEGRLCVFFPPSTQTREQRR